MRATLLLVIVSVLCPISIFNARLGIIGYTWFAILRPDILAWVIGQYPLSLALAICTLIGASLYLPQALIWFQNPITRTMLLLLIPLGVSVVAAYDSQLAWRSFNLFLRAVLMALLIPMLIRTLTDLRRLMLVMTFAIGFLGFRFGFFGLLRGGARYDSGYGGFLDDNNCVALALAMGIPLCWYCSRLVSQWWLKLGYQIMMFGSFAGIVWTHSRGGALSAIAAIICLAIQSKRKLLVLALMCACSVPAIYMSYDSYVERIRTIQDPDDDASAQSRIQFAKAGIQIWKDHPIVGVGFGSYNFGRLLRQYVNRPGIHVAHNTYVQVLADSGIFAFLLFVGLLFGTQIWLAVSARRIARIKPELKAYPQALLGALVAFSVGSTFLSRVSFDFYYILLATAAAWHTVYHGVLAETPVESALPQPVPPLSRQTRLPAPIYSRGRT
jgi:putative inorganic carbon (HCO3(-)) transporter